MTVILQSRTLAIMDDLSALPAFMTSLGIGLVMGLERQRRPGTNAGMRTFALASLIGTVCALLAEQMQAPWLLPVAVLGLVITMVGADLHAGDGDGAPDATTTVALVLCTLYGAMLWHGHTQLTVALAFTTTALLYFKTELHDASRHLSRQDIISFLQFGAITFVVLPILPDAGYGPYGVLNPYEIWLMVVLIAGVGLAGYMALRLAGPQRAPLLLGVLGGLVSSTATTLVFARRVRADARDTTPSLIVILTANLVLLVRLSVIAAVVAPGVMRTLLPTLATALVLGSIVPLWLWWRSRQGRAEETLGIGNPLDLMTALSFGLIYGVALIVTAWLHDHAGHLGVYGAAPIIGLTDVDAFSLSTLKLFLGGQLQASQVTIALALAISSNMFFKVMITWVMGNRALAVRTAGGFLVTLLGLVIAAWATA